MADHGHFRAEVHLHLLEAEAFKARDGNIILGVFGV